MFWSGQGQPKWKRTRMQKLHKRAILSGKRAETDARADFKHEMSLNRPKISTNQAAF